jgi:serine/threonine protein kinase/tetratricopeptide (TPR) repeat protein
VPPENQRITLGPFTLFHPLAAGGMGEVWRGEHQATRLPVAVKVLTAESARAPAVRHALRQEARATASLSHPHVGLLLDYGDVDDAASARSGGRLLAGSPYLVLELATGGTLQSWVGRPPSWSVLRAAILCVLDALAHAHGRGMLHRDVKPSNVLWCSMNDQRPGLKLMDFGVSLPIGAMDGVAALAQGTPGYMAPEQRLGDPSDQGPWTDLYGLGAMVWAIVQGAPPPEGGAGTWLPPLVSAPRGLGEWLSALLEPDPRRRVRRAADAAWALMRLGEASGGLSVNDPQDEPRDEPITAQMWLDTDAEDRETLDLLGGDTHGGDTFGGDTWGDTFGGGDTYNPDASTQSGALQADAPTTRFDVPRVVEPGGGLALGPQAVPPPPERWQRPSVPALNQGLTDAGLRLFGQRRPRLIGRDALMDPLWSALREVFARRATRVIALRGPAGAGLSAVARAFAERAHEVGAAEVISVTATPERSPSDGLPSALRRALRLPHVAGAALSVTIRRRLPELPEATREAIAEAILPSGQGPAASSGGPARAALAALSGDRVALVTVEDAPYDPGLLTLLCDLVAREPSASAPLLFVLVVPDEALEFRPEAKAPLETLLTRPDSLTLSVDPLPPELSGALAQSLLTLHPSAAQLAARQSQGSPRLMTQLIESWLQADALVPSPQGWALRADAPSAPTDTLWAARASALWESLDKTARRGVALGATVGMHLELEDWQRALRVLTGDPRALVTPLADALIEARLARAVPGGLVFAHFAARDALLVRAEDSAQARHAAIAEALAENQESPRRVEWLGRHLAAAGRLNEAIDALLRAAEQMSAEREMGACFALMQEAEACMRAAELPPLDPRWGELGLMRALYQERARDPKAGAELLALEAQVNTAIASGGGLRWQILRLETWKARCVSLTRRGAFHEALTLAARMADESETLDDPKARFSSQFTYACALGRLNRSDEALPLLEALNQHTQTHGLPFERGLTLFERVSTSYRRGQLDAAERDAIDAAALFVSLGARWHVASMINIQGVCALDRGELSRAETLLRQALDRFEALGAADATLAAVNLGLLTLKQGRPEDALHILTPAVRRLHAQGDHLHELEVRLHLLDAYARLGRWTGWDEELNALSAHAAALPASRVDLLRLLEGAADAAQDAGWTQGAAKARALVRSIGARASAERHAAPTG